MAQGGTRHFSISHAPFLDGDARRMFRVASISKIVVGQAVAAFVKTKATTWDADICDILGWSPRHPSYPNDAVTLGMVAGHCAGLDDAAGYVIPADQSLRGFFEDRSVFSARPGARFQYSNLGYVVLAAALEALAGKSFPEGIAAFLPPGTGFNWVGVSPEDRSCALPTYRRTKDGFAAQIDDPAVVAQAGKNPGVYSPQGGLRSSLEGMLTLAEQLPAMDKTRLWTPEMGAFADLDGVFESYGAGLQIFDAPRFYPRPLVGHFGNAYGFNGGVWNDAARDLSFAYALNGLPMDDESDDFSDAELAIFDVIARL